MVPNNQQQEWREILTKALNQAGIALSQLVLKNFSLQEFSMKQHPIDQLPSLLGDESAPVAAAFIRVEGDLRGYLLLIIPLDELDPLMNILLHDMQGPELVHSALGELGNIVGSAFLNCLADYFHLQALPTPPQTVCDMVGALLGSLAGSLAAEGVELVPVIHTQWIGEQQEISSILLWLPEARQFESLGAI